MALSHDGFEIPGIHQAMAFGEIIRHRIELTQYGNPGTAVMSGGLVKWPFQIPVWIFNNYNAAQLAIFLNDLKDQIGVVGTLTETTGLARSVTRVEFIDFVRSGDVIPPNPDKGHSIEGVLKFEQLQP